MTCLADQIGPCESPSELETALIEVRRSSESHSIQTVTNSAANDELYKIDDFERTPNQIRWVPPTDRLDHRIFGSWTVRIKSDENHLIVAFNLVMIPDCETGPSPTARLDIMSAI